MGTSFDSQRDGAFYYRRPISFLYNQGYFPQAPYPYSNSYRLRTTVRPDKKTVLELGWARNDYQSISTLDSNLNHLEAIATYTYSKKLLLRGQYIFTPSLDDNLQTLTGLKGDRHNFSANVLWRSSENTQLSFQYGTNRFLSPASGSSLSPTYETLPVVDTQHFFKIVFEGKF